MRRLAPLGLATLALAGCFGGGKDADAVARYEKACAGLPSPDELEHAEADDALTAAIERISGIDDEPAFVDAVQRIAEARSKQRTTRVELAIRYRVAAAVARDAGIKCAGLIAAEHFGEPGEPNEVSVKAPADLSEAELAEFERGRLTLAESGCLACHEIGEDGGDLGPDLTDIGDRLSEEQLARVLVHPVSPMPSFARLPVGKRDALVAFMADLRG